MKKLIPLIILVTLAVAQPFEFNQSVDVSFYFIENATINGVELDQEDWIGAFNGEICVGANSWSGSFTDIPVMGDDGSHGTNGYMLEGEIPVFRIYDSSEELYFHTTGSVIEPWYNFNLSYVTDLIAVLPAIETGCTDPEACNFDPDAIYDDGSCLEWDCNLECGGEAYENECGCVGGGTGLEPDYCYPDIELTIGEVTGNQGGVEGGMEIWIDNFLPYTIINFSFNISNINITGSHGGAGLQSYGYSDDGTFSSYSLGEYITEPGLLRILEFDEVFDEVACLTNCEFETLDGVILDCGDFSDCFTFTSMGCTDPIAGNYDPEVEFNDGSCSYNNLDDGDLQFIQDYLDLNGINDEIMELDNIEWENNRLTLFRTIWSDSIIPESLGTLDSLRVLELDTSSIPESIGNLTVLENLELKSYYTLSEIPETIGNLENLRVLGIQFSPITQLPESIGNLSNLEIFYMEDTELESLPESFGDLINLEQIGLTDTQLSSLPESIGNLDNLKVIDIRESNIETFPEGICGLSALEKLLILSSPITELPECINNLESLKELIIENGRIDVIPETITELTGLEKLHLYNHNIQSIPETIGNMTGLRSLALYNNNIAVLPAGISTLPHLQSLKIGGNNLTELPENIGLMDSLVTLHFSANYIHELPDSFVDITDTVEGINLKKNQLFCSDGMYDPSLIPEYLTDGSIENVVGLEEQYCSPTAEFGMHCEDNTNGRLCTVYYYSNAPFSSWQFVLNEIENPELPAGTALIHGFVVSLTDSIVVGFNLLGNEIPPDWGELFHFYHEGGYGYGVSSAVASDRYGNPLRILNDCEDTEYQCGNGDCIDSDLQCSGFADCGDSYDEYACVDNINWMECEGFDILHLVYIIDLIMDPLGNPEICIGSDVNDDGIVNILDVSGILALILNLEEDYEGPIWHVSTDGSDVTGDGSEGSPFASIQNGINATVDGDTVLVHPGTYIENVNLSDHSITLGSMFMMTGDTSYVSQTVIDGGANDTVIRIVSGGNPEIQGLTITNGEGGDGGGGILIAGADAELQYLNIINNSTYDLHSEMWGPGGGIRISGGNAVIHSCVISNNSANSGGGIACIEDATAIVTNSTISANWAEEEGGGLIISDDSICQLTDVDIIGNSSDSFGGGIALYPNSLLQLNTVMIANNTAVHGGGICIFENAVIETSTDHLSSIVNNSANWGNDISHIHFSPLYYQAEDHYFELTLDQFTAYPPTDYYAKPIGIFDIQANSFTDTLIDSDVFVSLGGNNQNSGLSPESPFRSVEYAMSRIAATADNPKKIHLAAGVYEPVETEFSYPIQPISHIDIIGSGVEETVLMGNQEDAIIGIFQSINVAIDSLTIKNGILGISNYMSQLSLDHVIIEDNNNTNYSIGAISSSSSDIAITNSIVRNNATFSGWNGAAIKITGGMWATLSNVQVVDNYCQDNGAGIYISQDGPVALSKIVISGNQADNMLSGMNLAKGQITVDNVTITHNNENGNSTAIRLSYDAIVSVNNSVLWQDSPIVIEEGAGTILTQYSDVQNYSGLDQDLGLLFGPGIIELDPLFNDPSSGDFSLSQDSPCINAGDPNSPLDPDGTIADMGAFYYHHVLHDDPQHFNYVLNGLVGDYNNFADTTDTGIYYTVTIDNIEGGDVGDEIGLMDYNGIINFGNCDDQYGEILVGAGVWNGGPLTITTYGAMDFCDNPENEYGQYPGWVEGNPIIVYYWRSAEDQVYVGDLNGETGELTWGYNDQNIPLLTPALQAPYDINGDQSTDIMDIIIVIEHILEFIELSEIQIEIIDTNNDGEIDILDIVTIIDFILFG